MENLTNYKIGETVFYMESNKPKSAVVEGILILQGEIKTLHKTISIPVDEHKIEYSIGGYNTIMQENCYASLNELKESLFSDLQ